MNKIKMLILLLILGSCNLSHKPSNQNSIDSTGMRNNLINDKDEEDDDYEQEFLLAYKKLIDSYNNSFQIDTTFIFNNDTFDIKLVYHCLLESNLTIPKSYFEPFLNYPNLNSYTNEDLKTHNFACDLMINKNGTEFLNKTITKNDFVNELKDYTIESYGILFEPYIKNENLNVYANFSISIPLTDIGIGVTDTIKLR